MARIVLVIDSSTGELIDVAGNYKEGGRYKKFAKRILSSDKNPVLDYGGNGGSSLTISKNGGNGAEINLLADKVNVAGDLSINGKDISSLLTKEDALDNIKGSEGQISVSKSYTADENGEQVKYITLSLDEHVLGKLEIVDNLAGDAKTLVKKQDLYDLVSGLSVDEDATLEDVKGTLRVLINGLKNIIGT